LALRFTGIERTGVVQQYWDMLASKNAEEFVATTDRLQLPYFNTIYADRAGEIFYRYNAALPKHAVGDYNFWRQIVPGDRSELVWSCCLDDSQLPRLRNPASGFVQNANDPPWLATWPQQLRADDYSRQLPPPFQYLRSQRSLKMLSGSGKLSFDEVVAAKFSTRLEMAERVLPELLAIAATSKDSIVSEAAAVLSRWDRQARADSRGAVLFIKWAEAMQGVTGNEQLALRPAWFAIPWDQADPLNTPRGIKDPLAAVAALKRAAADVTERYGALDVPYGDVYRLRRGNVDLPASVAHQSLGSFHAAYFDRAEDGSYSMAGGETFIAVVSFGPQTRAEGLMTYGNSSEPASPHFNDQLALFSQGKLRPLLVKRAEIERSAERREKF
jgi:acyl-homoserine-lactone acylase